MAASAMKSVRLESARHSNNAKKPRPECDAQHRVRKPKSRSAPRCKKGIVGVLTSQTLSQNCAEDMPLGLFNRLPYEVAENIWSCVAASISQDPSINLYRFKWPESWADNPGPTQPGTTQPGPRDLLALMACSKAMHDDVFPILKRHMRDNMFNISFSESHGVQFESIRCAKNVTLSDHGRGSTISTNRSVCLNDALSAFAGALPYIRYLNVTIELEYDDHLFLKSQETLDSYIRHACSLLSSTDTHQLDELNTNVRLHMDKISLNKSDIGKPTDIRINPPSYCPFNLYSHSLRNVRNWNASTARDTAAFMAQAITPLHELARTRNFLGGDHHVTLSDGNCIFSQDWDRSQTSVCRAWGVVMRTVSDTLKISRPRHQEIFDPRNGNFI